MSQASTTYAEEPVSPSSPGGSNITEKKQQAQAVAWVPPNRGLRAWLQVFGAFCLYFGTWGIIQAFGVFEAYYHFELLPAHSTSDIAWIGSLQSFLMMFVGILSGPLYDKGHMHALNHVGTALLVLGIMTMSAATTYWQLMLSQGVAVGIGSGLVFTNSLAVVPAYFTSRRAIAMALASLGSGIGGVIYPIVFHELQPKIGFGWAVRIMGFISLFVMAVPCLVMRKPSFVGQGPARSLVDFSHFRDPVYSLLTSASVIGIVGLFVPFYVVQLFAQVKLNANATITFYLIPILNAGSTVGRLLMGGGLATYLGPINMFLLAGMLSGIICLAWISVSTIGGCIAFAFFYGFTSGAVLSVSPLSLASITKDPRQLGTRIGMSFGLGAFGLLAGNPSAGALVNIGTESFVKAQVFGGVFLLAAGAFVAAALFVQTLRKRRDS
ncbi:major facilitator superfamily domain-containing protein [Phyllosticta citriasiana]|uniref:major facilitator superfamily domain-containing protein n=1 Tax=Phyllosticta citriasiana TaxID=595635 RepID=UPI0030FD2D35